MPDVDTLPEETVLNTPRLERVIAPITQASPTGDDVTYDDDFQKVKAEIDKLESPAGSAVDYGLVVELSDRILAEKSKDLRAAVYLTMGLTNTAGLKGAAEGVAAVHRMVDTFWDDLYPPVKRLRARRNALQALSDRVKEWVANERPTADDRSTLEAAVEEMKALQAFVLETMGDDAPAVSGLTRAFEEAVKKAGPKEEKTEAPKVSTPGSTDGVQAAPQRPAESGAPASAAEYQSVADAKRSVGKAIAYIRSEDDSSPVSYRLNRALQWGELVDLPPNENRTTRIPAPQEQVRTYLTGLLERGEHTMLLDEAESTLGEMPFWFDLQRLVAAALDNLGPSYEAARDAVLQETAMLLARFPGLAGLAFADGTPFADAATTSWMELQVEPLLSSEPAPSKKAAVVDSGSGEQLAAQYEEARSMVAKNNLSGALEIMEQGGADDSDRDRFRRRLHVASLCVTGGKPAVARPILESLDQQVREHRLDTWESSLALEVWTLLYRCYGSLAGSGDAKANPFQAKADDIFDRICGLDPQFALDMSNR